MHLIRIILPLVFIGVFLAGCSSEHDHADVAGFEIMQNNEVVVSQSGTTITGNLRIVGEGNSLPYTVVFRDPEGKVLEITKEDYTMEVKSASETILTTRIQNRWSFILEPRGNGSTTITLSVLHGTHYDFQSRPIPVIVESDAIPVN
jgi:hypothetical protein